ncbi:MAG: hypothetical protein WCS88_01795 [Patescibacteria group bacterium]|jgi:hypothetical protein
MLETSRDLLNVLLGASVLMVAILFSWMLYQITRSIKGFNDIIQIAQNIAKNIDEGVNTFKSKAGNVAAFLTVMIKGAQSILATVNKKKTSKNKK